MTKYSRNLKAGAVMSYASVIINVVAGLLYTPWMISKIGQSNYGLFTLATSLIAMFTLDFGMSAAVSRFIAKYRAEGRQDRINQTLGIIYKMYLIIDALLLVILSVMFFFLSSLYKGLTPDELDVFRVIYVMVAIFNLISFPCIPFTGVLNAYEEFVPLKFADMFNKIFTVICIVAILLAGQGLYTLVLVNLGVSLLTLLMKWVFIKKRTPLKVDWKYFDKGTLIGLFSFSVWTTIIGIAQRFIINITPSLLGALSTSTAIAVFGLAATIEGYVYTFATAINGLFMSKIARISYKNRDTGDRSELMALMCRVGRLQMIIIGLIFAGFVVVGRDFLLLWMGPDYVNAYYCTILMVIPSLLEYSQQIANTTVVVENKVKYKALVFVLASILNIVLSLFLTPLWGELGAALSIGLAYVLRTVCMNVIYFKVMKINMLPFYKECLLKMGLPIIVTIVLGLVMQNWYTTVSLTAFLIKGCAVVVIFFLSLLPCLNAYERGIFKRIFKRFKKS